MGGGGCNTSSVLPKCGVKKPRPPRANCRRWVQQCDCCCRNKQADPQWKVSFPTVGSDNVVSKDPTETMVRPCAPLVF